MMLTPDQFQYEVDVILRHDPSAVASAVRLRQHNEAQAKMIAELETKNGFTRGTFAELYGLREQAQQQAQRIRFLEQQEKAWQIAFDGLEKQHKALTDQIPADTINADPFLMERVITAAALAEIGRQQIADLQARVKELEADRDHWKRSAESSLHEFCQLQITYGEQKHKLRRMQADGETQAQRIKELEEDVVPKLKLWVSNLQGELASANDRIDDLRLESLEERD